jgi:hypothetical protein
MTASTAPRRPRQSATRAWIDTNRARKRAERLLEAAGEAAEEAARATAKRDAAIVAAVSAGAGQREVARATGLSHTGIAKILARAE